MPKPKAIYFDLDGTLLDVSHRFHRALNESRRVEGLGPIPWEIFQSSYGRSPLTDDLPAQRHGAFWKYFLEEFSHNPLPNPGLPFPGVPELLGNLQNDGYRLAVITNRASTSQAVSAELETMGLVFHFDAVLAQADFNFRKGDYGTDVSLYSKEAMIHHASEKLGVSNSEVVFVGDLLTDVVSSRKAGCALSVGVLTGGANRNVLESGGAHHVLEAVVHLPQLLGELSE